MNSVIIAFRSRTDSMRMSEMLSNIGVPNKLINTPRELSIGCGVAVSIDAGYYQRVKALVDKIKLPSYRGCYGIENYGTRRVITQLS